jgi:phosphatidyl-myo-inositol dimannoside synthase
MPGGIGSHAYCLAKELSAKQYEVAVLTDKREGEPDQWNSFLEANSDISITGIRRRYLTVLTYLERVLAAHRLMLQSPDSIIYSGKFSVWLNAIMPRSRSVVVIHGSEIKQKGLSKTLFFYGLKRASRVICVSQFTKDQLKTWYPRIPEEKVSVINNGIDSSWFTPTSRTNCVNPDKLVLVTVGGIHRRKGQANVVRALPRILQQYPNATYHIVGLPNEKQDLLRLVKELNVVENVKFHHGLSDPEVKDLLSKSDVFIMLSEHLETGDFEGFGIALMEGMARGLPAIGSTNSGIADAIENGISGRLVDPKKTEEISTALSEIVRSYCAYSRNAANRAKGFEWKCQVQEYLNIIEHL